MKEIKMKEIKIIKDVGVLNVLLPLLKMGKAFIAGGCVRHFASPHPNPIPFNDIDIFFLGTQPTDVIERLDLLKETLVSLGASVQRETKFSYSLTFHGVKIQLIKPLTEGAKTFGLTPEDVISEFDFTINACYLKDSKTAVVHDDFVLHELKRLLVPVKVRDPLYFIMRIGKFMGKGYKISSDSLKMVMQTYTDSTEEQKKFWESMKVVLSSDGESFEEK